MLAKVSCQVSFISGFYPFWFNNLILKTMSQKEIRVDCMSEIFEELGIIATKEQIEKIVEDFTYTLQFESEMSCYQHVGHKEDCINCKKLDLELNELKRQNEVFKKSVMKRRKTDSVWIEGDSVMYGSR